MRLSYEKHLRLANEGRIPIPDGNTAHEIALYGALASRYRAAGEGAEESVVWPELAPFLLMEEGDALTALAEYVAYQEHPKDAKTSWLGTVISEQVRKLSVLPEGNDRKLMLVAALINQHEIKWWHLLASEDRMRLEEQGEQVIHDLKEEDADLAFQKEAEKLLRRANYPEQLNRFFEVLRQCGLVFKSASTLIDGSETWEYLGFSNSQAWVEVTIRFWRRTGALDYDARLLDGGIIASQARGQTPKQLNAQLYAWGNKSTK